MMMRSVLYLTVYLCTEASVQSEKIVENGIHAQTSRRLGVLHTGFQKSVQHNYVI